MFNEIVLTGGSGFIAKHLIRKLISLNIKITVLHLHHKNIHYQSDLVSPIFVKDYSEYIPSDNTILIHMGEPSHVKSIDERGNEHIDNMVVQAEKIFNKDYERIIYVSSAAVYGDKSNLPHKITDKVVTGLKVYTDAKIAVEKILDRNTNVILRLTNVYGPGMSEINIFSDILAQTSKKGPIVIREKTPVREYIYIDDVVNALVAFIKSKVIGVYNLSTGESISCENLARKILISIGQGERSIDSKKSVRNSILRLDISKTLNDLNWRPLINLDQGINSLLGKNDDY